MIHFRVSFILLLAASAAVRAVAELPQLSLPPLGGPVATNRPLVVVVGDDGATEAYIPQAAVVEAMVRRGVATVTRRPDAAEGWRSLIRSNDVVGLKVYSLPGADGGTRPAVAAAVARSLLDAGVPPANIVIWDRRLGDLRAAGFGAVAEQLGVRLAGAREAGWDAEVWYESSILGTLVAGDHEFEKTGAVTGRRSHVSRLVSRELTKIIPVTPLLNHNHLGVSGHLYSVALGSVDNAYRFETSPGLLHGAVPEIFALPQIADKVVLCITDALVGQYQGAQRSLLHYAEAVNELRLGHDPVALDVLAWDDLNRLRVRAGAPALTNRVELFLNAALLELGETDPLRMDLEHVSLAGPTANRPAEASAAQP
ncbi:MAG: hypothetical protein ACKVYV_03850 [Limisphaerales bacterium]